VDVFLGHSVALTNTQDIHVNLISLSGNCIAAYRTTALFVMRSSTHGQTPTLYFCRVVSSDGICLISYPSLDPSLH